MSDMVNNGEALDYGRRLARRRMAWMSFLFLLLVGSCLLAGLFIGGPIFAINMQAIQAVLIALIGFLTTIVGAYLGVSLIEALKK